MPPGRLQPHRNRHPWRRFPVLSLLIPCETQEEIDYYWGKLSADPKAEQCGWLKDKYGLTWQIMPESLDIMMRDPDTAKADRVGAAMLTMDKLNISELEKAYKGE